MNKTLWNYSSLHFRNRSIAASSFTVLDSALSVFISTVRQTRGFSCVQSYWLILKLACTLCLLHQKGSNTLAVHVRLQNWARSSLLLYHNWSQVTSDGLRGSLFLINVAQKIAALQKMIRHQHNVECNNVSYWYIERYCIVATFVWRSVEDQESQAIID